MDILYFFRVLFKRKWIIVGSGILAGLIAFFLTRKEPRLYKSTSQISTGYTIKEEIAVRDENVGFFESEAKFSNVILIFKSQAVIGMLSYKLLLHDLTGDKPFRIPPPPKKPSAVPEPGKEEIVKIVQEKLETMSVLTSFNPDDQQIINVLNKYGYDYESLSNNLKVGRYQRTDYLQIDYLSENPLLSAYVVNEAYNQFLRYYTHVRDTRSLESIDTLKSIMDKKKQAVDTKRAFLTGEGAANVEMENSSSLERIGNLEKDLTDEKSKQTNFYYSLRKINQRLTALNPPAAGAGTNTNNAQDITANAELLTLKKAMNDTYELYINEGATDKNLLNKYNQLKSEYQAKYTSLYKDINPGEPSVPNGKGDLLQQKSDVEIDIQACEANIASIQARINGLKSNVVEGASKAASGDTLMKEVDLANKEYLDAKQRYSEALDISTSFVNNFRQVLPGQPATEAEPSKKKLVIGMAAACASIAAILVIVVLTYLDSSIKTPGIFAKAVDLKLISMVNFMNLKNRPLAEIIGDTDDPNAAPGDKKRLNIFRESLRKLRYEVEISGKKIFLFTSTMKGEGKTTLIQALSYSLSLSRKRILIIDTNFCNNDLTVQLHATPILETLTAPANDFQNMLSQVRQSSTLVGSGTIFIIGSEGGDYTPSEILPTGNILQHLAALTAEYDYIFLEGPPLNDYSDSKELVKYVDCVIAVFSAAHIIKQIDKESIAFFKGLNGKFAGSVLNKVELENVNVT
jgi:succinoglycan biosynthesis transport protein ExoP